MSFHPWYNRYIQSPKLHSNLFINVLACTCQEWSQRVGSFDTDSASHGLASSKQQGPLCWLMYHSYIRNGVICLKGKWRENNEYWFIVCSYKDDVMTEIVPWSPWVPLPAIKTVHDNYLHRLVLEKGKWRLRISWQLCYLSWQHWSSMACALLWISRYVGLFCHKHSFSHYIYFRHKHE